MDQLSLLDLPATADPDPKWTRPDREPSGRGERAGYCLECDKGVWLSDIQKVHPDATLKNFRAMQYDECPTCKSLLIPF